MSPPIKLWTESSEKPGMCFVRLLTFAVVAFTGASVAADEPSLLRRREGSASASTQCCNPGEEGTRCLERLTRLGDGDETAAACATAEGLGFVSGWQAQSSSSCPTVRSSYIGIKTPDYPTRGWWGRNPPARDNDYKVWGLNGEVLPVQSWACRKPNVQQAGDPPPAWEEAREHCARTGYKPLHLHITYDAEKGWIPYTKEMADADPWSSSPETRSSVRVLSSNNFNNLTREIVSLVQQCYLIDYAHVINHGGPGVLFDERGQRSVENLLRNALRPCFMTPRARIQIAGCNVACRPGAEQVRGMLARVFESPDLGRRPSEDAELVPFGEHPVRGIRFLFNTHLGNLFLKGSNPSPSVISKNNVGIEFTARGSSVTSDLDVNGVEACH